MNYSQLQATLKGYRNEGIEVLCKLNAKASVLQAEIDRIEDTSTTEPQALFSTDNIDELSPTPFIPEQHTPLSFLPLFAVIVFALVVTLATFQPLFISFIFLATVTVTFVKTTGTNRLTPPLQN